MVCTKLYKKDSLIALELVEKLLLISKDAQMAQNYAL